MTECLLSYNDIIIDDTDIINDNNEKYIPKLFKPITEDNILIINEYSSYKKLYQDNNLRIFVYHLIDHINEYNIELLLIYKNTYQLFISYYYDRIYERRGIKEVYIRIGSMSIFKKNNKCIQYIDRFEVWTSYDLQYSLSNILDDINKLGSYMTYYKFISILKEAPFINQICEKYEKIYSLLPDEIRNRDLFSIISEYL
jgi:hypothetical protein